MSVACEESTLKVKVKCMSHGGLDSRMRSRAARPGSERGGGVENVRGGGAAGARERLCAVPALMQERELREGIVRRCEAEGRRSHWPSTTGTDPAASSGLPPAIGCARQQHWRGRERRGRQVEHVAAADGVRRLLVP
eukprot:6173292-Pleurochrysis_carterae.AAC.1